jgi:hypothetical protein
LDGQDGSACLIKRDSEKREETVTYVYLKDVPLDVRKKEAKKPLFLIRYE